VLLVIKLIKDIILGFLKCDVLLQTHVIFPILSRFNVLLENMASEGLYIRKEAVTMLLSSVNHFCKLFHDDLSY